MEKILLVASWIGAVVTIAGVLLPVLKALRKVKEGQKCLLRNELLRTYYRHREEHKIRQYEFENFVMNFDAYAALGGNGFMKHIRDEVDEWEVVT